MRRREVHLRFLFPLLAALAAGSGTGRLQAGDDLVQDAVADGQPAEVVRFAPAIVHGGGLARVMEYDLGALFDQHVFRQPVGRRQVRLIRGQMVVEGEAVAVAGETLAKLAFLRPLAERRIDTLDRICRLNEHQRETIRLAWESDLRRLAGEIDAVRRGFIGRRLKVTPQGMDRDQLQAVRDDAAACRARIERVFQTGSLLGSVSLGMLSASQRSALEAWVAERRRTRWEAMVRTVLDQFDESLLGLSSGQHEMILEHLLADVPPLEVFGSLPEAATGSGDFQGLLVLSRLARLDQPTLRERCDPRQWAALERLMGQHGSPEAVERLLVEQGVLQESD